jgi:hypothetical protein
MSCKVSCYVADPKVGIGHHTHLPRSGIYMREVMFRDESYQETQLEQDQHIAFVECNPRARVRAAPSGQIASQL